MHLALISSWEKRNFIGAQSGSESEAEGELETEMKYCFIEVEAKSYGQIMSDDSPKQY